MSTWKSHCPSEFIDLKLIITCPLLCQCVHYSCNYISISQSPTKAQNLIINQYSVTKHVLHALPFKIPLMNSHLDH